MTPWPRVWALESDCSVQIPRKCVTPDNLVNCRAATTVPALQGSLQDDGNRTRNFCSTWKLASRSCSVVRGHLAAGTSLCPRSQARPIHLPGPGKPALWGWDPQGLCTPSSQTESTHETCSCPTLGSHVGQLPSPPGHAAALFPPRILHRRKGSSLFVSLLTRAFELAEKDELGRD